MSGADANPFDDPAVQNAAFSVASDPGVQSAVGSAMMKQANNDSSNAYSSGWQQDNQDAPPSGNYQKQDDKTCFSGFVEAAGKFSALLPLRYMLMFMGCGFIAAGIWDFIKYFDNALDLFVNVYLIFFGVTIVFIEWPQMSWNSWYQDRVFYWALFLSRLWGRALLYFFLAILCCSDNKSTPKILFGVLAFLCVFIMYFVGVTSASKMKRIAVAVAQGREGDERIELIRQKFRELDTLQNGYIGEIEIEKVAEESGRKLSASERETISRFFNKNFVGQIDLEEWMEGFDTAAKGLRSL